MRAWLGICAMLGAGSVAVAMASGFAIPAPGPAAHPLAWNAIGWVLRPWTLWTAAWVHTSSGNLGGNLLALAALAVFGAAVGAGRRAALALLVAWPLGTLALLIWPQVRDYSGLGGAIHAAAMVLAAAVARRPGLKFLSPLLFAGQVRRRVRPAAGSRSAGRPAARRVRAVRGFGAPARWWSKRRQKRSPVPCRHSFAPARFQPACSCRSRRP